MYEQLLSKSQHVKVWISYATWLFGVNKKERDTAREIFRRAYKSLKEQGLGEERVMLLEKWLAIDQKCKKEITAMMPKKVKRRKEV